MIELGFGLATEIDLPLPGVPRIEVGDCCRLDKCTAAVKVGCYCSSVTVGIAGASANLDAALADRQETLSALPSTHTIVLHLL